MKKFAIITLFYSLFTNFAQSAQLNFCSITLNSSDEIDFFKRNLPGEDFKFTELTSEGDNFDQDWMKNACQRQKQGCDVLLISGHFAGEVFFGVNGKSGRRVFTHHLLDKVCKNSCNHILKKPKLVFLFGGHTLSDKTEATSREKRALAKAVSKEIGAGAHQRLAEARYGVYGKAYLEQMKKSFGKHSTILGFDGRGIRGSKTKSKLKKFLRKIKDLKASIENNNSGPFSGGVTTETVESISPVISESFVRSFGSVGGTSCDNSANGNPELSYSNLNSTICLITDESKGYIYNKLEIIGSVLRSSEQANLVLPWIEEFF